MQARQLERQVAELRRELALHDAIAGRSGLQYTPYSAAQRAQLRGQVLRFLQAEPPGEQQQVGPSAIEPLELLSVRHMLEVLALCRELYRGAGAGAGAGAGPGGGQPLRHYSSSASVGSQQQHDEQQHGQQQQQQQQQHQHQHQQQQQHQQHSTAARYVGDVEGDDASQSGGVGVAPDDCRPGSVPGADACEHAGGPASCSGHALGSGVPADRGAAWEAFKDGPGRGLAEALTQNKLKGAQVGGGRCRALWPTRWPGGRLPACLAQHDHTSQAGSADVAVPACPFLPAFSCSSSAPPRSAP
jgi:hypothetical protein